MFGDLLYSQFETVNLVAWVLKSTPQHIQFIHFFMMSYNTDFVEARADDIFDGWVTQFFRDLTPTDESALYSLALDKAIEEANWEILDWPRWKRPPWSIFFYTYMI